MWWSLYSRFALDARIFQNLITSIVRGTSGINPVVIQQCVLYSGVSIVSFVQGSLLCPLFRGLYCVLYSGVYCVLYSGVSIVSFIQGSLLCPLFRGLYSVLYSGVSIVSFIQGSLLCPLFRGLYCVLYSGVSIVSFIFGYSFMGGSIIQFPPAYLRGPCWEPPTLRLMTSLSHLPFKVTGLDWQSTHTL